MDIQTKYKIGSTVWAVNEAGRAQEFVVICIETRTYVGKGTTASYGLSVPFIAPEMSVFVKESLVFSSKEELKSYYVDQAMKNVEDMLAPFVEPTKQAPIH